MMALPDRPGAVMELDDKVCYCFHVTRRKLVNFIRRERPRVPSQLSLCGGAGTGCGWCIPFLRQLHDQAVRGGVTELETLSPAEYEQLRASYVRAGKGTPPPGATPLPPSSAAPDAGGAAGDGLV
jgi:NAD(P)H-nitrite reductase large subunit